MTYEIEHNIPITSSGRTRQWRYPFSDLEVGDSFLVPIGGKGKHHTQSKILSASRSWKKYNDNNVKFATRTTPDGIRVWRVK